MDDGDVSNSVSCSKSTFIGETLATTGCWLRVIESRGAGCGASVELLALLTGLKLARTLRNFDAAALRFSLFFRKSGRSKFISVPR